ncbi:mycothiol conjugate amidase Mca [Corynebacterium choanae]|uniref:Mycothiol S-conjugate amidase n=1 Tax=Corynebacterium choanae TaxID=1862358 RepID=A0A3G6J5F1_9CORY|nr:mycothiol conjugate amidase Mca [Corynebacterium choanae]AZA13159.1 Mycothiol S-conjugate amidase [Corynebacterium choanae]
MAGYRILAVHAHPDDESSKGAATMARYVAEGHRVMVATMTGGEAGSILNPAMDRPGVLENITAIRREEMANAAKALGIEHRWMGFIDSGLPEGDPLPELAEGTFATLPVAEAAAPLVALVREFRPHIIITYDEHGGYPHPDHIQTHKVSMFAFDAAADPDYHDPAGADIGAPWEVSKMYYTHGFVPERLKAFHEGLLEAGLESPFAAWLQRFADNQREDVGARVTTKVRCGAYFPQRDDALRAHATQIDPHGFFFAVPLLVQQQLWDTEEFELARWRGREFPLPEDELYAGLPEAK